MHYGEVILVPQDEGVGAVYDQSGEVANVSRASR